MGVLVADMTFQFHLVRLKVKIGQARILTGNQISIPFSTIKSQSFLQDNPS